MTRNFQELSAPILADPRRRARVEERRRAIRDAHTLAKLREAREMTQTRVAEALDVSQANVSRIERQEDLYLSTLSSYVAALGGRLEVRAVFPDESVVLLAPTECEAAGDHAEPVAESAR